MLRSSLTLLLFAGVPAVTLAQQPDNLEQRFEEAERYYKVQKFQAALDIYEELYLKTGSPELLYNIGQCYRLLGQYDKALKSYNSFLRDVPDTDLRPQVEALIAEIKDKPNETKPTSMVAAPESKPATSPASTPGVMPDRAEGPSAKPFFLSAGGLGAVWAVSGLLALRASRATKALVTDADVTQEEFDKQKRAAKVLGVTADVSFIGALVLGGVGFSVRSKSSQSALIISPSQLLFSMEF